MKKKEIINISLLSDDLPMITSALFETKKDSECAIIGASYVDKCLYNILFNKLPVNDENFILEKLFNHESGVLDTFSARNKVAYALRIIDKTMYEDIRLIGNIRNRFAHDYLNITFSENEISKQCQKLKLWEKKFPSFTINKYNKEKFMPSNTVLKEIFINSCIVIMHKLVGKGLINKKLNPKYY